MDNLMENIDWQCIHFNELDILLLVSAHEKSVLNEPLINGLTPLCLACKFEREDLVTILLHHGARTDICASNCGGKYPLHFACDSDGNRGVVLKLLKAKADINAQDNDGNTALHLTCKKKHADAAVLLIKHGANVNLTNGRGFTALLEACDANTTELVDILLREGSNPNLLDGYPLQAAVQHSSVEIWKLLIRAGADVDKRNYLNHALWFGDYSMFMAVLKSGANVNKLNILGESPLQFACMNSNSRRFAIEPLLEYGADVLGGNCRTTLLHMASSIQCYKDIKLLLAYGADVNAEDFHSRSPLIKLMDASLWFSARHKFIFMTARLFLAAGCKFPYYSLKIARRTLILAQETDEKLFDNLLELLTSAASNPQDLQSQCRIVIRKSIAPNKDKNVEKLPLPPQIIRFLKFNDIK